MKVQFGDVIEIRTNKGLAYALYTHRHDVRPRYGAILRVMDKSLPVAPSRYRGGRQAPCSLHDVFSLQAAVDRELLEVVGNVPVPEPPQDVSDFSVRQPARSQDQEGNVVVVGRGKGVENRNFDTRAKEAADQGHLQ